MLFLSGATIPYELFPSGLQKLANVLPLTQGIKLMKAVSMGAALEDVWKIVLMLVGITVICTVISVKTFRWDENMSPYVQDCEIIDEVEFKTE